MKSIVYCHKCEIEFKHMNSFLTHHRWHHDGMTTQEYYDQYLKKGGDGICQTPGCNKQCNFYNLTLGYHKHCSRDCVKKDPVIKKKFGNGIQNTEKIRQTCLSRYGVENISQLDKIKEKKVKTSLKNNGYKYWVGTNEHKQWMKTGGASYCNRFIKNPSKPQIKLFQLCQALLPYPILNYPCCGYSIDIAIPTLNLAIEYDGSYWHQDEQYDKHRQEQIENEGWVFLRYVDEIPEKQQLNNDIRRLL